MRLDSAQSAPESWQRRRVEDVCARVTSGGTPSRRDASLYEGGTVPWVKTKELNDAFLFASEELITEQALTASSAKLLPAGTILLAMYGATVGMLGILGRPMACNQACCALIPGADIDRDYLYYQLLAHRQQLQGLATGAAQQNLSGTQIKQMVLPFPSLPEQRAIGSTLRVLDDRIALLRETNATLEAIAQALFKSWFVDFDPVRAKRDGRAPEGMDEATAALFPDRFEDSALGEVPRGWSYCSLKEVTRIFDSIRVPLSGAEREKRRGEYPYYGAAALMDHVDDYLFDGVYLLTGEDGSVADVNGFPITQYVWGKFWVNNHAHVLQGANGVSTEHLMLALKQTNIQPYITGAVQAKLSQSNMWRIQFMRSSPEVAAAFSDCIAPLFASFRHNADQAQTLSTLRDTLLPRLISGQLRLPATIEEALA